MKRVELKITFVDDDGAKREENRSVETSYSPNSAGEHRLAHILATEMKVMVGEHRTKTQHHRQWMAGIPRSSGWLRAIFRYSKSARRLA